MTWMRKCDSRYQRTSKLAPFGPQWVEYGQFVPSNLEEPPAGGQGWSAGGSHPTLLGRAVGVLIDTIFRSLRSNRLEGVPSWHTLFGAVGVNCSRGKGTRRFARFTSLSEVVAF